MVQDVLDLFQRRGSVEYHGESVSQLEHALQAASLAEAQGASEALIVAALLHDVGHMMHDLGEDAANRGLDDTHEEAGAAWLARHFPPEVTEPIRLHVAAKRYLCATSPGYLDGLSPASRRSLQLQGGPMNPQEQAAFESNPHHANAVRLRRWDDGAKVAGLEVADLEHYRGRIAALARSIAG